MKKILKCEESESSQKQEHFSQWKPICDTIHTKQSNKTKIHTLETEEKEEEEWMSVRARVKNMCQEVCPQRGKVVPGSSEIKTNMTTPKAEEIVVVSFLRGKEWFNFFTRVVFFRFKNWEIQSITSIN